MASMFGTKNDLKLINFVKCHKALYDYNHPNYKDYNEREILWQKISDSMRRPAKDCKRRWGYIRDTYRTMLRRTLRGTNATLYKYHNELAFMTHYYRELDGSKMKGLFAPDSESAEVDIGDEANADQILEPTNKETAETDESETPVQGLLFVKSPTRKRVKKRRSSSINQSTHQSNAGNKDLTASSVSSLEMPMPPSTSTTLDPSDKVDSFLLSIGSSLKTFSPYHLNLAKSKIFSVVQDHELQMINSEYNYS